MILSCIGCWWVSAPPRRRGDVLLGHLLDRHTLPLEQKMSNGDKWCCQSSQGVLWISLNPSGALIDTPVHCEHAWHSQSLKNDSRSLSKRLVAKLQAVRRQTQRNWRTVVLGWPPAVDAIVCECRHKYSTSIFSLERHAYRTPTYILGMIRGILSVRRVTMPLATSTGCE